MAATSKRRRRSPNYHPERHGIWPRPGSMLLLCDIDWRPPARCRGKSRTGSYPDQTNDLKTSGAGGARYPGGNGKVGAIGGSAGASHDRLFRGHGDERRRPARRGSGRSRELTIYVELIVKSKRHHQRNDRELCRLCQPGGRAQSLTDYLCRCEFSPLYVVASDDESMPPDQLPDLVRKLKEVGATNFKQLFRENSQQHAFCNWPDVRHEALIS